MSKQEQKKKDLKEQRREIFWEIVDAFGEKYSWLGSQASRELLLSAASYNLEEYSDPPMRYRTHVMLAWDRGWVKSTMLIKMANILGDSLCSTMGKVTGAGMRGSISQGQFMPPKPVKTPIVISTEFGETNFQDELLNIFLSILEEGKTNVSLNKIGALSGAQKENIEKEYPANIEFTDQNEFNMYTNSVFWGATYDPRKLEDDALRSRFNVVTPVKPLSSEITRSADNTPKLESMIDEETVRSVRRHLDMDIEMSTSFRPPDWFYKEYRLNLRESRDMQSRMACRNWWGLEVDPDVMKNYIEHLKESRRLSRMDEEERVLDLIFNKPHSYEEIQKETGMKKLKVYKILDIIGADKVKDVDGETKFAVWSGDKVEETKQTDGFLDEL